MATSIKVISSMATKQLLADLSAQFAQSTGHLVSLESVGGVDAAKRVRAGEAFDCVILASNVIDQLIGEGRMLAGSRVDLVKSGVSVVVKTGSAKPDISTEAALKNAVTSANSIGYSTGPSGAHLMKLFERWGIAESIKPRIAQAKPGIPVGTLVAKGEIELGFQQLSELIHLVGVDILGPLPPGTQTITTFSGAVAATAAQADAVRAMLAFFASPAAADAKRKYGMDAA
ncbi:MAG: ABC transporter substrate-binding protein [Betaproteobacteria bacterium]|nr:ABC transporter substrate-binding protein [Betaproteobacteria bacterium]